MMAGGNVEGVNVMRALLLAIAAPIAAMSVAVSPAAALDPPTEKFAAASAAGVTIHHGLPPGLERGFRGDGPGHDGDRRRRRGGSILFYDRD